MDIEELKRIVARGEDSHNQFKEDLSSGNKLAAEMVAFSNADGGRIYLGVDKFCKIVGLSLEDVERLNQQISNTASQNIRSPITVFTENVAVGNSKIVIVVSVSKGMDKPYFDKNGVIWFRNGSNKRRINSKVGLCQLFQSVGQSHADKMLTKASLETLDIDQLKTFVKKTCGHSLPRKKTNLKQLLANMNLVSE